RAAVGDDADDLGRRLLTAVLPQLLAERAGAGEVAIGAGAIDEGAAIGFVGVGRSEVATFDEADPENVEISRRDRAHRQRHRVARPRDGRLALDLDTPRPILAGPRA